MTDSVSNDERPYIWVTPARHSGHACVGGTRIPTAVVSSAICCDDGESIDEFAARYDLTRGQVICAIWYEQQGRRWSNDRRTREGKWIHAAHRWLASPSVHADPGEWPT